jgi:hypothetical protein
MNDDEQDESGRNDHHQGGGDRQNASSCPFRRSLDHHAFTGDAGWCGAEKEGLAERQVTLALHARLTACNRRERIRLQWLSP